MAWQAVTSIMKTHMSPAPRDGAPPAPANPLLGRQVGGYVIEKSIGAGALAVVYRARNAQDDAVVALKILNGDAAADEDFLARFNREAELSRRLTHPNIVTVYDHGQDAGLHYLAMELVEGRSMEAAIDADGPMPWLKAGTLFLQLGQALAYLGRHGVIHRDIKPANVILTNDGRVKLIDLGFAKHTSKGDLQDGPQLTLAGMSLGSPGYMAPEQVLDAKEATASADIYGLGASFFHALTGRPPFDGPTVHVIMQKVLHEPPPPVQSLAHEVPPAISALIAWTLRKEARKRPESALVFVRELENALCQTTSTKRVEPQRRKRIEWLPILCIAIPAILVVVVLLRLFLK